MVCIRRTNKGAFALHADFSRADAGAPAPVSSASPSSAAAILALVEKSLDDDKAVDVVSIDLAEKSSVTDALVIASGRSQRHVAALADHLIQGLKEAGFGAPKVEGMATADWVLIDAGDVVIHLFRPEVRMFYNLEKMWADGDVTKRAAF